MAKLYLAFTASAISNYTPTRISTTQSSYSYELTYMTRMDGSITRGSTTYSQVFEISDTTIPSEYVADNTMDVWDYWLDDEDSTVNRSGPSDYGDVTTTVHVWECDAVENSSQRIGAIPDMISGTYIYYFDSYTTYSPVTTAWVKNGNTYNISVPDSSSNNNLWVSTSHSLTAGKTYSISVTSKSEANYDGVIVTSGSHSSSSAWSTMTGWSDYVCGATGNNVTNTATFTATSSNRTLYLYFKTDGSTISPSPETGSVTITESSTPPTPTYAWTKSGNTYSISVGDNGQWILQQVSVTVNHTYSISMTVACEKNYDGIYLGTASHSSGERVDNMASNSDCIMVATSSTSGTSTTTSTTWKATTSTIYLYFYTDSSTLNPNPSTGSVTFTDQGVLPTDVTVTLNKNNGSGGTSSVSIANGTSASNYPSISLPSRSGFTFLGYYDAQSGGTQYYTASGAGARTFDKTSNCTFYAHWKPNISNSYQDGYIYCTYTAEAYTKMKATDTVNVAVSAPTAGAGTVSVSVLSPYSSWTFASNKTDLNVPKDTPAGTYEIVIAMSVAGSAPSYESNYAETTIEVEVIATSISSAGNVTVSYADTTWLDAEGETITIQPSLSQSLTWNNGQTSTNTSGTYSYTVVTSKTGFSLSNGRVTVVENPTAMARGRFEVKITGTANGKSGTLTVGFNQYGSTIVYSEITLPSSSSYEYPYFYARGESQTPRDTITYSQTKSVNGTVTETITSGATLTFKTSGTLPSWVSTDSDFSSTGSITCEDRDDVVGPIRYADSYFYVEISLNGKTKNLNCSECYQEANALGTQHYKNTSGTKGDNLTYGTPTVSIGSGIAANGGSAIVTCSVSNTTTYYLRYTSLSYTSLQSSSSSGVAVWRITSNGNNRFSHPQTGGSSLSGVGTVYSSGDAVKHSNMTTNATTDTVIVTAYNMDSTSKTATATVSATNSLGTTKYKTTSGTSGYNIEYTEPTCTLTNSLTAAGGTVKVTCSVTNNTNWYLRYSSGSYSGLQTGTEAGTTRWRITSNGNSRFSHPSSGSSNLTIGGTAYPTYATGTSATHSSMTTYATTDTVGITAYNAGDTTKTSGEKTASVSNAVTTLSLSVVSTTISYNGSTTFVTTATYTSGVAQDVTTDATYTDNPTGVVSINKSS